MNLFKKLFLLVFILISFYSLTFRATAVDFSISGPDDTVTGTVEVGSSSVSPGSSIPFFGKMMAGTGNTAPFEWIDILMSAKIGNSGTSQTLINNSLNLEPGVLHSVKTGSKIFTTPTAPGNYLAKFLATAFGNTEYIDVPFTVASLGDIVVNVTAIPSIITNHSGPYPGNTATITWKASPWATSCSSLQSPGLTATSGTFNALTDTTRTYTITCTAPGYVAKSGSVTVGVISLDVSATPAPNSSVSWSSSYADYCNLSGGGSSGSGTSNSVNVGPVTSDTTFTVTCVRPVKTINGSCSGTYQGATQSCNGEVAGSTCGISDGTSCSGFSMNDCYMISNPWCHHGCYVGSTPTAVSCSGLSQTNCTNTTNYPGCIWSPTYTIPSDTITKTVTVTAQPAGTTVTLTKDGDNYKNLVRKADTIPSGTVYLKAFVNGLPNSGDHCHIIKNGVKQEAPATIFLNHPQNVDFYVNNLNATNNNDVYQLKCYSVGTETLLPYNSAEVSFDTQSIDITGATTCNIPADGNTCSVPLQWNTINPYHDYDLEITQIDGGVQTIFDNEGEGIPVYYTGAINDDPITLTFTNKVDDENNTQSSRTPTPNTMATKSVRAVCATGTVWGGEFCRATNPDLIVSSHTSPISANINTPVALSAVIKNNGTANTKIGFNNRFQIALDPSGTDILTTLPVVSTGSLASGLTANISSSYTFANAGTYYVKVCAGMNLNGGYTVFNPAESTQANNCSSWKAISIEAPDLIVSVTPSPTVVSPNSNVTFSAKIKNMGSISTNYAGINQFFNSFQVSTDGINVSSKFSATTIINSVNPGTEVGISGLYTTGQENFYLRACTDLSDSYETKIYEGTSLSVRENNNCSAFVQITIPPNAGPDLISYLPTTTANPIIAGEKISIKVGVKNNGTGDVPAGMFRNTLEIAEGWNFDENTPIVDPEIYVEDFFMGSNSIPFPMGSSSYKYKDHTFNKAKTYYVRVCADKSSTNPSSVTELNETNNCSNNNGVWTAMVVKAPDLVVSVDPHPNTVTKGESVSIISTIKNQGNLATSGGFDNIFQVSENSNGVPVLENHEITYSSSLADQASAHISHSIIFPEVRPYYVRACADLDSSMIGNIYEGPITTPPSGPENNNCGNWTLINSVLSLPTVTISAVPTTGQVNSVNPSLSWSSTNAESCVASGDWTGDKAISGNSVSQGVLREVRKYSYNLTCNNQTGAQTATAVVNVYDDPRPNLVASNVTPATAVVGVEKKFNSTISNIGISSTGGSFSNFFQLCQTQGGCEIPQGLESSLMGTLASKTSGVAQVSHVFNSAGIYSIRACADKDSAGDTGDITESNEEDNCSTDWVDVIVTNPVMTGTLTPSLNPCIINSGENSCEISLNWSINNTEAVQSQITANNMLPINLSTPTIGGSYSGVALKATVPYEGRVFYLYNNEKSLVPPLFGSGILVRTECVSGTFWNGTICDVGHPDLIAGRIYTLSEINYDGKSVVYSEIENQGNASTSSSASIPKKVGFINFIKKLFSVKNVFAGLSGSEGSGSETPVTTGFYNLFQVTTDPKDSSITVADYKTTEMKHIGAGVSSVALSPQIKFEKGDWVRACADKDSAGDSGDIIEWNNLETGEKNNCSEWIKVDEIAVVNPWASISSPGCEIGYGESSCEAEITWSSEYTIPPVAVTTPNNKIVGNTVSGSTTWTIEYEGRDFFFYHNNGAEPYLARLNVIPTCATGTEWSSESNVCGPEVKFSAAPTDLPAKGGFSTLTWSSTNANYCEAFGDWDDVIGLSGTKEKFITVYQLYKIQCTGNSNIKSEIKEASVRVGEEIPSTHNVDLSASKEIIVKGGASVIEWNEENWATSCDTSSNTGYVEFDSLDSPIGNFPARPINTTTFIVTCSNADGTETGEGSVVVRVIEPNVREN